MKASHTTHAHTERNTGSPAPHDTQTSVGRGLVPRQGSALLVPQARSPSARGRVRKAPPKGVWLRCCRQCRRHRVDLGFRGAATFTEYKGLLSCKQLLQNIAEMVSKGGGQGQGLVIVRKTR